jgi:hypothetical protein
MEERRIIGLDLGIASEHTARVLSGDGKVVAKRKAIPTTESLSALEVAALTAESSRLATRVSTVRAPGSSRRRFRRVASSDLSRDAAIVGAASRDRLTRIAPDLHWSRTGSG